MNNNVITVLSNNVADDMTIMYVMCTMMVVRILAQCFHLGSVWLEGR